MSGVGDKLRRHEASPRSNARAAKSPAATRSATASSITASFFSVF